MSFKKGTSGNLKGRPVGSKNKRPKLMHLLEPHAEKLIYKMISMAMGGDVNALRLCIERLLPKIQHEAIDLDLPEKLNEDEAIGIKGGILAAAIDGNMSVTDAGRLIELINAHAASQAITIVGDSHTIDTNDPVEASRIYQKLMG